MSKRANDPIIAADLQGFVTNDSDFGFEMQVLTALRDLQFTCSHSATYEDPVTGKIRQFDIRAFKSEHDFKLALAVECKNIRPYFPLLVSAVPRTGAEAFHDRIIHRHGWNVPLSQIVRHKAGDSAYGVGEMVGKKIDQVRRDGATLVSDDSVTFDKLNQAINSCRDLIRDCVQNTSPPFRRVVLPVLVVPQNALWQVDYTEEGTVNVSPRCVPKSTLFIQHAWSAEQLYGAVDYCVSHLEIVTINALGETVNEWFSTSGFFDMSG